MSAEIAPEKKLIQQLLSIGCVKYGDFELKSGLKSKFYVNLREISMYPDIFRNVVEALKSKIPSELITGENKVAIIGVPYGVVPVAVATALSSGLAYYPVRKETKSYGLTPDTTMFCDYNYVVIEDIMSTGSSIIETLNKLEGKKVSDVIVLVDRELGGRKELKDAFPHIRLHSVLSITSISAEMPELKAQ